MLVKIKDLGLGCYLVIYYISLLYYIILYYIILYYIILYYIILYYIILYYIILYYIILYYIILYYIVYMVPGCLKHSESLKAFQVFPIEDVVRFHGQHVPVSLDAPEVGLHAIYRRRL